MANKVVVKVYLNVPHSTTSFIFPFIVYQKDERQ